MMDDDIEEECYFIFDKDDVPENHTWKFDKIDGWKWWLRCLWFNFKRRWL